MAPPTFFPIPRYFHRRAAASVVLLASLGATPSSHDSLRALWIADHRLANVAYQLTTANADLCDQKMPATGIVLHALDQYAPAARAAAGEILGITNPIAIEGVVANSPGEHAGFHQGDGILAVNDSSMPDTPSGSQSSRARDSVERIITALPADRSIAFRIARAGTRQTLVLNPQPACRARFEVLWARDTEAKTDGEIVQVAYSFLTTLDDADLAVVVAHELAHVILRHRKRLEAANASKGLFSGLGRSGRLNRQAEDEADRLSIHLLHNAGLDPRLAVQFWQKPENRSGFLMLSGHRASKARAALLAQEIGKLPAIGISRPLVLIEQRKRAME